MAISPEGDRVYPLAQTKGHADPLTPAKGAFYGWWMVLVSAVIMALGVVPLFHGMAAWFPVLETRFGWSRAQLSLAFSLTRVEGSIMGPAGGYLIERWGPRRMVLVGLLILGAGMLALSRVQELWHLYGAFIIMSTGVGLGTWLPAMTVLNNWFIQQRATAMAWSMAGISLGGILVIPALAWAIDPEEFGPDRWRPVAAGMGVFILLVAWPISALVRNRPEDYGQNPDGRREAVGEARALGGQSVSPGEPDYTWQQALRTRNFWLITLGHAGSSIVITTLMVHMGSMLNLDRGLSLQTVGWVVATTTAVGALFTLVGGYVGDRVSIRVAVFGFSAIQAVAIFILLQVHSASTAFLFAVVLGVGFGGRVPLTTAIRGVYFGRRAYASITGMSMVPMNILFFIMPLYAGYMHDRTDSYSIPFITVAAVCLVGSCLFLLLGEPRPLNSSPGGRVESGERRPATTPPS